ncbi:MAG TPA: hypothetical protein VMR33_15060 [Candidatus Baltobacteraceae bacterium]|jgi:hypothetical protein|nr:hypothetical protein [Candidatus Baltobacteraceae bacterium]
MTSTPPKGRGPLPTEFEHKLKQWGDAEEEPAKSGDNNSVKLIQE